MYPIDRLKGLQLNNPNVDEATGFRQMETVSAILQRFGELPGVILADEVGMGKTFVALGVAASIAFSDATTEPVVIMVPSGLMGKWPTDLNAFKAHCLPEHLQDKLRSASANNVLEFLKLLDDPQEKKAHIIFLKHGAISATRSDRWIKLAVMRRALKRRRNLDELNKSLDRFLPGLVHQGFALERKYPGMLLAIFRSPVYRWKRIAREFGYDAMHDDPVPESVIENLFKELPGDAFKEVLKAMKTLPRRKSRYLEVRLKGVRQAVDELADAIWKDCARHIPENLPLLILDEAHHTKNARTRLASLFHESEQDAGQLSRVFERMLFLTATPFQLGHNELCSILRRFEGIRWNGEYPPAMHQKGYEGAVVTLNESLDEAQIHSKFLDETWGRLDASDLVIEGVEFNDENDWWCALKEQPTNKLSHPQKAVLEASEQAEKSKLRAENLLRRFVFRHLRDRMLTPSVSRRIRHSGELIGLHHGTPPSTDQGGNSVRGLPIDEKSRLPFLLAARYAIRNRSQRAVFAEGLASSYHTFLRTKPKDGQAAEEVLDTDEQGHQIEASDDWHLDNLQLVLEQQQLRAHPKLSETVARTLALWESGENVLVFCHFVQTGRDLHRLIGQAMEKRIRQIASKAFKCSQEEVESKLDRIGRQLDASSTRVKGKRLKSVYRQECLNIMSDLPSLSLEEKERFIDVTYRYLRTPSFLVRYFPLSEKASLSESSIRNALDKPPRKYSTTGEQIEGNESVQAYETLRLSLRNFFEFQAEKSDTKSRSELLATLESSQSGRIKMVVEGESETFLPNVRLVNGGTKQETRHSLMQTFNTPFFPEVLVASAVMSEGVDLHRNCRHVIHHDLCWSPSTLEQRTGRVDRIQSKGERMKASVSIYLPFIAHTQDEKMYRVVMDRERWFNIVMGDKVSCETEVTELLAERILLPTQLEEDLSYDLSVINIKSI